MTGSVQQQSEIAFGRDLVLSRKQLKPFTGRTNSHGLINLAGHLSLLCATGWLVYLAFGSWWILPAMLAHGFVMAFLFAPVHECSHGTTFRSRWLNETVYWLVCLIYLVPPIFFRYAHAAHHTYTQIRGHDPDMLPERMTVWSYVSFVLGVTFWKRNMQWFLFHPLGKINPAQRYFLPDSEIPRVVRESRIIVGLYAGIAVTAIAAGSWAPLVYWVIPRFIGEPFMRWFRIAEHAECMEGPDLRENTRTTRTSSWINSLFWNMPYHAEHHICPMVPFHALPRLHQVVRDKLFPVGEGYLKVHADVLSQIVRRQGVTWKTHTTDSL